jgi:RNA polymerase sigma factor (sigma-70 family)
VQDGWAVSRVEDELRTQPEALRREVYEDLRPLLFSIAYGIVSSVSEAEDIVQEAFLRFHREQQAGTEIGAPRAWLSTVTTRLAINNVRSARVRRETYVGTWLPEPLLTDPAPDASVHAEAADSLSMAFLVLLESLSPVERAVFLLREVFGYGYERDRRRGRQERGELPTDRRSGQPTARGEEAAVRGLTRTTRGARPALLRRGGRW